MHLAIKPRHLNAAWVIDLLSASPMFSPLHISGWHRWLRRNILLLPLPFWGSLMLLEMQWKRNPCAPPRPKSTVMQCPYVSLTGSGWREKVDSPLSLCIHLHNFWAQYGPLWGNIHLFCKKTILPALAASLKVLASGKKSCSSWRTITMITSITSERAGPLARLIWSFLYCQAFTVKLYNPCLCINKDTADSGLYNIFACETKHTDCHGSIFGLL